MVQKRSPKSEVAIRWVELNWLQDGELLGRIGRSPLRAIVPILAPFLAEQDTWLSPQRAHLESTIRRQPPKSEYRRPKPERRPNTEGRSHARAFRVSDFGLGAHGMVVLPRYAPSQPQFLECGGKRSATPLSAAKVRRESGVAAALCHRSPNLCRP